MRRNATLAFGRFMSRDKSMRSSPCSNITDLDDKPKTVAGDGLML